MILKVYMLESNKCEIPLHKLNQFLATSSNLTSTFHSFKTTKKTCLLNKQKQFRKKKNLTTKETKWPYSSPSKNPTFSSHTSCYCNKIDLFFLSLSSALTQKKIKPSRTILMLSNISIYRRWRLKTVAGPHLQGSLKSPTEDKMLSELLQNLIRHLKVFELSHLKKFKRRHTEQGYKMVFVYLQTLEFLGFIKPKKKPKQASSFIPGTQDPIGYHPKFLSTRAVRPNFGLLKAVWNRNIPRGW